MNAVSEISWRQCSQKTAVCWVCVWSDVYVKEFIPLVKQPPYNWASRIHTSGSKTTWLTGKDRALQRLAVETYGEGSKPFRLISRRDHFAFKECAECKKLRLEFANL
eukprot:3479862-Pleurochrysis_carterae.AAC.1